VKHAWLDLQLPSYPVLALCEVLEVSLSGYRSWKRGGTPQPKRLTDIQLLTLVTFRRIGAGRFRRNGATGNGEFEGSNGGQGCLILPSFASGVLRVSVPVFRLR